MRRFIGILLLCVGCDTYVPPAEAEATPARRPPPRAEEPARAPKKPPLTIEIKEQAITLDGAKLPTWPLLTDVEAILGPSVALEEGRGWPKHGITADLHQDGEHVFTLHAWRAHEKLDGFAGTIRIDGTPTTKSVHAEPEVFVGNETEERPGFATWLNGRIVVGTGEKPCKKHRWDYRVGTLRTLNVRQLYLGFAQPLDDVPCT